MMKPCARTSPSRVWANSVRGTNRLGKILLDLSAEASEEGLVSIFSLHKGAYATTVLKEVMKNPDD